jgi:hypothetical protein
MIETPRTGLLAGWGNLGNGDDGDIIFIPSFLYLDNLGW